MKKIAVFWFRRDLRLEDNCALFHALNSKYPVLPIFIFDKEILSELPKNDARVQFIHQSLSKIKSELQKVNTSLYILNTNVVDAWEQIFQEFNVKEVFFNKLCRCVIYAIIR